jgi:probable HAF family extracellular repeat protein
VRAPTGRRHALAAVVALAALAGAAQAQATGSLTMLDLGVAPGDVSSDATGINASGVIIGTGRGTDDKMRPWIYQDGTIARAPGVPAGSFFTDINDSGLIVGTQPGGIAMTYQDGRSHKLHPALGDNWAEALAVDADGTVVGASGFKASGVPASLRPVLWPPGSDDPIVLDIFPVEQSSWQQPNAIRAGRVVGQANQPLTGEADAFAWQGGIVTPLRDLPGDTVAVAVDVDSKGRAVGFLLNPTASYLPVRWNLNGKPNVLPTFAPAGPPHPAPPYGVASAVSSNGLVVGESALDTGIIHAVAWKGGTLIDLGSLLRDSAAYDVTTGGRIVGYSRFGSDSGPTHAVLWTLKGKGPAA